MKKSQLRQIIREEIQLIQEASVFREEYPLSSELLANFKEKSKELKKNISDQEILECINDYLAPKDLTLEIKDEGILVKCTEDKIQKALEKCYEEFKIPIK